MKTYNTELFDLIKTMTKAEKAYFKKISHTSGSDKIYLRLFDEIEKLDEYNEEEVKEKFKAVKQFSVIKNQLYGLILKSLNLISESHNYNYELLNSLQSSEILLNRGLIQQAEKLLLRTKKKAYETEDFIILLQIMSIEKKLLLKKFTYDTEKSDRLYEEENTLTAKLKNLASYQKMFNNAYRHFFYSGYIRNKEDEKSLLSKIGKNFGKLEADALSKKAKIYFYETMHIYYTARYDPAPAMEYNKKSLALMEENPPLIKSNVERYLSTFQNHILQYFYMRDFHKVEEEGLRLKKFLNEINIHIPPLAKLTSQGKLLCITLSAFVNACWYDKAGLVLKEAEEMVEKNSSSIDKSVKNIINQLGSFYCFVIEDYDNSLRFINKILNDPDSHSFLEVYCFNILLRLLVHYELGDYDLIDYIIKSTKRYLEKSEKLFKIEKVMLAFFSKIINAGLSEKKEIFAGLQIELDRLKNDPEEVNLEYYDFASWCESKVRNVKFQTVLQEKFGVSPVEQS